MRRKKWKEIVSLVLCGALLMSQISVPVLGSTETSLFSSEVDVTSETDVFNESTAEENDLSVNQEETAYPDTSEEADTREVNPDFTEIPIPSAVPEGEKKTESVVTPEVPEAQEGEEPDAKPTVMPEETPAPNETEPETSIQLSDCYKNGKICIYDYEQLQLIGTDSQVHEGDIAGAAGTGEVVFKEDGQPLTYSMAQDYFLVNDIDMGTSPSWRIPDGFMGSITGSGEEITDKAVLAKDGGIGKPDTIYLYNQYQISKIKDEGADYLTNKDMFSDKVGTGLGQVYQYLSSNHYILSASFQLESIDLSKYYEYDEAGQVYRICIYNLDQLNQSVKAEVKEVHEGDITEGQFGKGRTIYLNGVPLLYRSTQNYKIKNDIKLGNKSADAAWRIPPDFQGTFAGQNAISNTSRLVEESTSVLTKKYTLYFYNHFQLDKIGSKDAVTDLDMYPDAERFGKGNIFKNGNVGKTNVTYADGNEYWLSQDFTLSALDSNAYYKDGRICIYNYEQLQKMGTSTGETPVYVCEGDIDGRYGQGRIVYVNGKPLKYEPDADYYLMSDIPVPDRADNKNEDWIIPEDFTGDVEAYPDQKHPGTEVYDKESNTIYLYNRNQLAVLYTEEKDVLKTVMNEDADPEKVGTGQPVKDSKDNIVNYERGKHEYVITSTFTMSETKPLASTINTSGEYPDGRSGRPDGTDGRQYFGEVVRKIGNKNYILIGNAKQLEAIGTDVAVTEPIWKVRQKNTGKGDTAISPNKWEMAVENTDDIELYYPGDADLIQFSENYDWHEMPLYESEEYETYCKKQEADSQNNDKVKRLGKADTIQKNGLGRIMERWYYCGSALQEMPVDDTAAVNLATYTGGELPADFPDSEMEPQAFEEPVTEGMPEAGSEESVTKEISEPGNGEAGQGDTAVKQLTYDPSAVKNVNIGQSAKYTEDADYIIFRDIFVTDTGTEAGTEKDWDPIDNFTGTMEGRNQMKAGASTVISPININQTEDLVQNNLTSEYGIGFFRNLSQTYDNSLQIAGEPISVSNITLDDVTVVNSATKAKHDFSLVGGLLTVVLKLLGMNSGLETDPRSFATGALVGSVRGRVVIQNCDVTNLHTVSNAMDWTGGLIGCTSGITQYEPLTGAVAGLVDTLGDILNLIPFLGLGDLVKVLLTGGVLNLKNLIPVAYVNAVVTDCDVTYAAGGAVTGRNYTGGWVGESVGTLIQNCNTVTAADGNTVSGRDYTGGFNGKAANAVVSGLLSNLGIDLMAEFPVNTVMLNCHINGTGPIQVSASTTADNQGYAGGFVGAMSNSYAVDCGISNLGSVAGQDYVGGFTGKASMGDLADIDENKGLLDLVKNLLSGVLTGQGNTQILSLVGLKPSVITGAVIGGSSIDVTARGRYAGGLVGYAGAVQISNTKDLTDAEKDTSQDLGKVLTKNGISYSFGDCKNAVTAGTSMRVSANSDEEEASVVADKEAYAGGILGKAMMTSVGDVLKSTVTAADYMRFELRETTVNGGFQGLTVTAAAQSGKTDYEGCAGGAVGQGIGGEIRDVAVRNIKEVTASKNAGGFAGYFGSGRLANVGGVNLLGLAHIGGLFSVAAMIKTFTSNCEVSGIPSGFTVTSDNKEGCSGGFIGSCVSGKTDKTRVLYLKEVSASMESGRSGGFAGSVKAGDALATIGEDTDLKLIDVSNLLGVISAQAPEFNDTVIQFVSGSGEDGVLSGAAEEAESGTDPGFWQVHGDRAGGFVGDGEAIDVNYGYNKEAAGKKKSPVTTSIENLASVKGSTYAGGFAGVLTPGDLAQTGSIKALGILDATDLLKVMDVSYPSVSRSGIQGPESGMIILAEGSVEDRTIGDAGGYIGNGKAVIVEDSDALNIASVKAPNHAGGYIGIMRSGSAVEAGDANSGALLNLLVKSLVDIGQLTSVLQAASSRFINCKVAGPESVGLIVVTTNTGDDDYGYAGGYVGEMQSGLVDNEKNIGNGKAASFSDSKGTAVENLVKVEGLRYAGGFGGRVKAGAVADVGDKISVAQDVIGATGLLSVINAFRPVIKNASVRSLPTAKDRGFTVKVTGSSVNTLTNDVDTGSAGGFIGYGSGVQVEKSDVRYLASMRLTEPSDIQQTDGSVYYTEPNRTSAYAVYGYRTAGGYFGEADIGSTASVGGASILKKLNLVDLGGLASALEVVNTNVEDCDVYGAPGGFNVLADNADGMAGKAGGFAGSMRGTMVNESDVNLFAHIIGRESAGGYVGTMEPGNVASAVENLDILGGLLTADNLLSALRTFVPRITNSDTTCIPCGGAVRADASSKESTVRGAAGGYAGYSLGGQITNARAYRIRSVYGVEFAGGYTGLMQCANLADTGSIKILFKLIELNNPLSIAQAVYPVEKNTAVYGPLRGLTADEWNSWVKYVGEKGAAWQTLTDIPLDLVDGQAQLDRLIEDHAYGYCVTAGRQSAGDVSAQGGCAGGYVGRMEGGVINNGQGVDLQEAEALFLSAGGFAGEMLTGTVANAGNIDVLGLDVLGTLPILQTFVPKISNSSVRGCRSGAVVHTDAYEPENPSGFAGGYVGRMVGGQIWGNDDTNEECAMSRCTVSGLHRVNGKSYVGGFVGQSEPGSLTKVNTEGNSGLLNKILGALITAPADLVKVLQATMCTIRSADVSAWDPWGIVINGSYVQKDGTLAYAKAAGGFAGSLKGTVIGERRPSKVTEEELAVLRESGCRASGIRSVTGGEHAGGFFGLADVAAVAEVSGDGKTSILDLITAGSVDVLDSFRAFVYFSSVSGSPEVGLTVTASAAEKAGTMSSVVYTGNAGGFGGSLLDGSVKDSQVTELLNVNALNYSGGFIGHTGKSGVVDLDNADVLEKLLGLNAGVLDVFGSNIHDCSVQGMKGGYMVSSRGGEDTVAGGFVGYGDLARIVNCTAGNDSAGQIAARAQAVEGMADTASPTDGDPDPGSRENGLKQVYSDRTAGGFIGRTSFAYLATAEINSAVVEPLLKLINAVVEALMLDKLEQINLIKLDIPGLVEIGVATDGKLVSAKLLGLEISIALSEKHEDGTGVVVVRIGDSEISLDCDEQGNIINPEDVKANITVNLIKANRSKVENCQVYGVSEGYDVYGSKATNSTDGEVYDEAENKKLGSGGFVGFNNEGLLKNNNMYYCDVVRGTAGSVGPFTGSSSLKTVYEHTNNLQSIEGEGNRYRIYRKGDSSLDKVTSAGDGAMNTWNTWYKPAGDAAAWNIYTMEHVSKVKYSDLKDAVRKRTGGSVPLDAYVYTKGEPGNPDKPSAMAVLMDDTPTRPVRPDDRPEPSEIEDPCSITANITINKIWRWQGVLADEGEIPSEPIHITLHRKWTQMEEVSGTTSGVSLYSGEGERTETKLVEHDEIVTGYENIPITGDKSVPIWQKVLKGLPIYVSDPNDETGKTPLRDVSGEIVHYTYYITETPVAGYVSSIISSADGYTFTITNKHDELPETGGEGVFGLYLAAVCMILWYIYTGSRKRKKEEERSA